MCLLFYDVSHFARVDVSFSHGGISNSGMKPLIFTLKMMSQPTFEQANVKKKGLERASYDHWPLQPNPDNINPKNESARTLN